MARALEAVIDPTVLVDASSRVRFCNRAADVRFRGPAAGSPAPWRLFSLDGEALEEGPASLAARTATVVERRVLLEEHDGTRQPTLVRAVPLWEGDGASLGVLVTFVDAAHDALADLEEYRRAFDLSDDILIVAMRDGRVLRVNDGATRMLGWPPGAFLGEAFKALIHPDDLPRSLEVASSGQASRDFINRVRHRDGHEHLISWMLRPERSPIFGPVVYLRGVDVTLKLRREEELVASREQLAEAQDIAHIGTVALDYRTRRLEVSPQFRRLAALSEDADVQAAVSERVSAPDRARLEDAILRGRTGQPSSLQLTARLPQGNRVMKVWMRPHKDAKGSVVRLVAVVQDITEEVRLTAQLRLAERMASLGTLASGIAHEVNNPLAFVVSNLNTVRADLARVSEIPGVDLEDLRAALSEAQEGAERVAAIVGNLKAFSRGDDERLPAACDLRPILEGVLNLAHNETLHRARVVKRFEPVPLVMANQARLGQVFLNLVLNAAQAIPDGHVEENVITVSTRAEDGHALVTVEDTGHGIAPEHLSRVFDPFFSTKDAGRGTGLGLFIAQGIVRELGGEIELDSSVGVGSKFRVRLPANQAPKPAIARAPDRAQVLVVDDEPLILRSLLRTVGRTHEVTTATSGREALELLAKRDFDLVLCDMMMPELSGMELWERLSEEKRGRVVFMTGGTFTPEAQGFLEAASPPVLQKPFTAEALASLLEVRLGAEARGTTSSS